MDYQNIRGTKTALEIYAAEHNYELVTVTTNRNGYPAELHNAIIGFETFGAAEEAAEILDGRCVILQKRDGHDFWFGENTAFSALKSEDFRDENNTIVHASLESLNDREWLKSEIETLLDMEMDLSFLKQMLTNLCETEEKIKNMRKGQIAIMSTSTYLCDIIDEYVMKIHDDDVTTYTIGVKV